MNGRKQPWFAGASAARTFVLLLGAASLAGACGEPAAENPAADTSPDSADASLGEDTRTFDDVEDGTREDVQPDAPSQDASDDDTGQDPSPPQQSLPALLSYPRPGGNPPERGFGWTGVDWDREGLALPYQLENLRAGDLRPLSAFAYDPDAGIMFSSPNAEAPALATPPMLLPGGDGVALHIDEIFHGVFGRRQVRLVCGAEERVVAWVLDEEDMAPFLLPSDASGVCLVQLELHEPSFNARWEVRSLTIFQWHGDVAWAASEASEVFMGSSTPVHVDGRTWVVDVVAGRLAVAAGGPGGGWTEVSADTPPMTPATALTVVTGDAPQVLIAGGDQIFAGELVDGVRIGAWRLVAGDVAKLVDSAPWGDGIAILIEQAGEPVLRLLDADLEQVLALPVPVASGRLATSVTSVETGLVVTYTSPIEPSEASVLHLGCDDDSCSQPQVSPELDIGPAAGPLDVLGTGSRTHIAFQRADTGTIRELWLGVDADAALSIERTEDTALEGARPLLGFMGTAHVMVYADEDGVVRWAYRPTLRLAESSAWSPGPDWSPNGLVIEPASLAKLQVEAEFVLLARTSAGNLARRSVSRAISQAMMADHDIAIDIEDASLWALSAVDFPVYAQLGAAVWGWPAAMFPTSLSTIELCGDDWCDACGGSQNCMGIHLSSLTSLSVVVHEIGHHVAVDVRPALVDADVFAPNCTADNGATVLSPVYDVDGAPHHAGFSPSGRYYDCRFMGDDLDHHFVNVANAYMGDGSRLRRVAAADIATDVAGMDEWHSLLADKYVWVRDHVFAVAYRENGVPCVRDDECQEASGLLPPPP